LPDASSRSIIFRGGPKDLKVDLDRAAFIGDYTADPCLYAGYELFIPGKAAERVQVVGEVNNPREIELTAGDKLSDLLSLAGGFRRWADPERVEIIRGDELLAASSATIMPGDVIRIPAKAQEADLKSLKLFGAITKPGQYEYSGGLTLSSLLDRAGGLVGKANTARATVFRRSLIDENGQISNERFPIMPDGSEPSSDLALEPGDSIFVPYLAGFVKVDGYVKQPGLYPYSLGKDASYYIKRAGGFLPDADRELIDIFDRISKTTRSLPAATHVQDGDEIIVNQREELK
jgi:protein involved in polysaccharide export with SLBB domain